MKRLTAFFFSCVIAYSAAADVQIISKQKSQMLNTEPVVSKILGLHDFETNTKTSLTNLDTRVTNVESNALTVAKGDERYELKGQSSGEDYLPLSGGTVTGNVAFTSNLLISNKTTGVSFSWDEYGVEVKPGVDPEYGYDVWTGFYMYPYTFMQFAPDSELVVESWDNIISSKYDPDSGMWVQVTLAEELANIQPSGGDFLPTYWNGNTAVARASDGSDVDNLDAMICWGSREDPVDTRGKRVGQWVPTETIPELVVSNASIRLMRDDARDDTVISAAGNGAVKFHNRYQGVETASVLVPDGSRVLTFNTFTDAVASNLIDGVYVKIAEGSFAEAGAAQDNANGIAYIYFTPESIGAKDDDMLTSFTFKTRTTYSVEEMEICLGISEYGSNVQLAYSDMVLVNSPNTDYTFTMVKPLRMKAGKKYRILFRQSQDPAELNVATGLALRNNTESDPAMYVGTLYVDRMELKTKRPVVKATWYTPATLDAIRANVESENSRKLNSIIQSVQTVKNISTLENNEYTADQMQSIVNGMLGVLKEIADLAE